VSAEARFVVGLAALLLGCAAAAYVDGTLRRRVLVLAVAGLAAGLALLLAGATLGGAAAGLLLTLGLAGAAAGLASLGRAAGAGRVGGAAGALLVVLLATTGLFWADPVAERLPAPARRAFRQAVLHLDAATALAHDAAGFDRLMHTPVYANVPLASSTYAAPRALPCALAWGALGALAALAAGVGSRACAARSLPPKPTS
jgi:hypothetical protein